MCAPSLCQGTVGLILTSFGHILADVETFALPSSLSKRWCAIAHFHAFLPPFSFFDGRDSRDGLPRLQRETLLSPREAELMFLRFFSPFNNCGQAERPSCSIPAAIVRPPPFDAGCRAATHSLRGRGGRPPPERRRVPPVLSLFEYRIGVVWTGLRSPEPLPPFLELSHISYGCLFWSEVSSSGHANLLLSEAPRRGRSMPPYLCRYPPSSPSTSAGFLRWLAWFSRAFGSG